MIVFKIIIKLKTKIEQINIIFEFNRCTQIIQDLLDEHLLSYFNYVLVLL